MFVGAESRAKATLHLSIKVMYISVIIIITAAHAYAWKAVILCQDFFFSEHRSRG